MAGGVSIHTQKQKGYLYQDGMIASSDGHCRAFDKNASGTTSGEGAGVVVLKRLSEAIRDRDHIYSIIKGSAINNDGNRKVGYTAPSVKGQADCIRLAHLFAKVPPESIGYIETHGTGTRLGDPIELEALNVAFNNNREHKCAIGSVKTNIGHLDVAAGIAGLIKASLSLKYKKIPASLHYEEANPEINFAGGPFYVNTQLVPWARQNGFPLRAGVSSFGIGGTNVHVVLEEAPDAEEESAGRLYKLLTVSAKTESSLFRYLGDLRDFLLKEPALNLSDMSYTLHVGRKDFLYRKSLVYKNRDELVGLLEQAKFEARSARGEDKGNLVVFMFPGQGSQYWGMGRDLYEFEPFFREEMDKGFSVIEEVTGECFRSVMFAEELSSKINDTRYTQPLIFLLEYSLSRLMMSLGIVPRYMIGHSVGEFVAACISGVFSFEDALKLVVRRGDLLGRLPGGAMLSVSIKESNAGLYLDSEISLAAINGPDQVVFSGPGSAIERLKARLEESGIPCLRLRTSHAFHSGMVEGVLNEFKKELEKVRFNKLGLPYVSNLTGRFISEEEATSPSYWVRHMRETVNFSAGLKTLLLQNQDLVFVEIGSGHSLTGLLKQHRSEAVAVNLLRSFKETDNDLRYLTEKIGDLWSHGINIDWTAYYSREKRRRVSLPTYSFEPIKYPTEVDPFEGGGLSVLGSADLLDHGPKDWVYYPVWKSSVLVPSGLKADQHIYLFFSQGSKFTNSLKTKLLKGGNRLVEVLIGNGFKKVSDVEYIVDPGNRNDFQELFGQLKEAGYWFTDVVYGWGSTAETSILELHRDNQEINLVYFCVVHIVQELLRNSMLGEKRIIVLTDCLHKVIGNEEVSIRQSLLLGLINVLPQEYSVSCCNIDTDIKENGDDLDVLVAEIENSPGKENIVAIRYGQRWVKDYQQSSVPVERGKSIINKGGTYLITGGLGNVGFVLAKHLLKEHGAKVVLLGRKILGLPENRLWSDRLDHLSAISKDVSYYSGDVSDLEAFGNIINEIEKNVGVIAGIIHAAGNTDTGDFELVEDITYEKAFAIFLPKVQGVENLYTIFKDRALDFVWITSSLSSVLGGLSFSSYSSANLFMEHFISSRSKELLNWRCVGLSEMLFDEPEVKDDHSSKKALTPTEISELFEWSIALEDHPVLFETIEDLSLRLYKVYGTRKDTYLDSGFGSDRVRKSERPELKNDYVGADTETEKKLIVMIEDFFGIKDIGIQDNFFELGGDSLKAMVLLKQIKKEFGINFKLNSIFESQNIKQIASEIDNIIWLNQNS
ncbi:type I polyketide synthase, partial [Pedobacter jeongneungensis]|uniref:type I polyketide synthase n=1 Tax=Pedobacter jeongneungensis TaxID=947309 RepID=UPI0031EB3F9D